MAERLDSVADLVTTALARLQQPEFWWQLGVILFAAGLAWLVARSLNRLFDDGKAASLPTVKAATALAPRVAFLTLFGLAGMSGAAILRGFGVPHHVAWNVGLLALALALIRLMIGILKRVLRPGPLLAASEHVVAWTAWLIVALYILGWVGPVAVALDAIAIPLGKDGFSLLDALRMLLTMVVFVMVGAWLGAVTTRRLMSSTSLSIGLRVGVAKFVRLFLVLLAGLLGLNAIGIDLAALTVFGGALGIGLGFGLQRIAANFVSGFILVGDRSIRQGDVITIGERFGVVKELRARYMVVRDRDGVDTLIPNENVISAEVVNWSYSDRSIRLKLAVQISYQDNPREALSLLLQAAAGHARVLKEPAPASRVMAFGSDGIDLELRYWIRDPEDGISNVRSDLLLAIWDLFAQAGITIPYPQRDIHMK
jgi:small-conductance mechanosensitive channel